MPAMTPSLLIISRDALWLNEAGLVSDKIFRLLAKITRRGCHLLLTAPEPDEWLPTRGSADGALARQGGLQKAIADAGGNLDGVYYVPRSLLTQDRNREGALRDILERYSTSAESVALISFSAPFIKAAEHLKIDTRAIGDGPEGTKALEKQLKRLLDQ